MFVGTVRVQSNNKYGYPMINRRLIYCIQTDVIRWCYNTIEGLCKHAAGKISEWQINILIIFVCGNKSVDCKSSPKVTSQRCIWRLAVKQSDVIRTINSRSSFNGSVACGTMRMFYLSWAREDSFRVFVILTSNTHSRAILSQVNNWLQWTQRTTPFFICPEVIKLWLANPLALIKLWLTIFQGTIIW